MSLERHAADLAAKRDAVRRMGGPERVEKQHARGKLTARERIERLFDPGTFLEIGIHGTQMMGARYTPADGCITGYGKIRGRWAAVIAYDFTVLGGSIGETGERKATRIREIALRDRMPVIWLVDSAGARISPQDNIHGDQVSLFAGSGFLFKEQVVMSGVVPQVAAMVGPGAAGTAYIPGLADFVPMVKGTSSMALGGPPLVKAVVGEDITEEDLGGSKVHNEISGVADLEVESDEACIEAIKEYLSFFPQSAGAKPERRAHLDVGLMEDKILSVVPAEPRQGYDMRKLVRLLADDGRFFEMKPRWAKNIVTGFARFGGFPVGIVANNPLVLGGALDVNAADKAARFVWLCDAFEIPLLFLADTPGFLIGSKMEQAGIIRHGAKMLYAVSEATVPKITVVVRKSYGAGYYVMCGRAYDPDLIVSWPCGEISVMGAEGMAGIAARKMMEMSGGDPAQQEEIRKQMVEAVRGFIDIYKVAGWAMIDDVIDPRETRKVVVQALEMSRGKTVERPRRKHGVIPV